MTIRISLKSYANMSQCLAVNEAVLVGLAPVMGIYIVAVSSQGYFLGREYVVPQPNLDRPAKILASSDHAYLVFAVSGETYVQCYSLQPATRRWTQQLSGAVILPDPDSWPFTSGLDGVADFGTDILVCTTRQDQDKIEISIHKIAKSDGKISQQGTLVRALDPSLTIQGFAGDRLLLNTSKTVEVVRDFLTPSPRLDTVFQAQSLGLECFYPNDSCYLSIQAPGKPSSIVALNLNSKAVDWTWWANGPVTIDGIWGSERYLIAQVGDSLHGIDRVTGSELWVKSGSFGFGFLRDTFFNNTGTGLAADTGAERYQIGQKADGSVQGLITTGGKMAYFANGYAALAFEPDALWRTTLSSADRHASPVTLRADLASAARIAVLAAERSVIAVDVDTGRENWASEPLDQIVGVPAMSGQGVYVAHGKSVSAFDLAGNARWTRDMGTDVTAFSLPVDDLLVVALGNRVVALRPDGTPAWRAEFQAQDSVVSGFSSDGSQIFFGDAAGMIYAVDKADGGRIWSKFVRRSRVIAPPLVANDMLFYGDPTGGATAGEVIALNVRQQGQQVWGQNLDGAFVGMALTAGKDRLIVCDGSGRVRCFKTADGSDVWPAQSLGPTLRAPPAILGKTVLIGLYGEVAGLNIDTGQRVRTIDTGTGGQAYPAAHPDGILVVSDPAVGSGVLQLAMA